ncbi:IS701 family transposase [Microbispora sp. NPDC004025]
MEDRPRSSRALPHVGGFDDVTGELYAQVFASLHRSDQRRRAQQYVQGLLSVQGRKSMRGIAAVVAGESAEQNLHHFISSSTWRWQPVRQALARYLDRSVAPLAWVVRSVVIPKAGRHSVGVQERYVPHLGRVVNCQQALGVWLASEEAACPVDWRLVLSGDGGRDTPWPRTTSVRGRTGVWTPEACALDSVTGMASTWGITRRPVVFDGREVDAARLAGRLAAAGLSFLARIDGTTPLAAADAGPAGGGGTPVPAQRLVQSVKRTGRPVGWVDHSGDLHRVNLVATIQVTLPVADPSAGAAALPAPHPRSLLLLAEWNDARRWPTRLWLTDMAGASPGALLRLSRLIRRVDKDFSEVSDHVGMRDFEGRSYEGWNRHTTLASIAHAASMLTAADIRSTPYAEEKSA